MSEKSEALPFLPKPQNLSGYVGDVGFDPLRISDYFPMDYLREAEIKHGRICMLAFLGYTSVDMGLRIYPLPPIEMYNRLRGESYRIYKVKIPSWIREITYVICSYMSS